jgi:hypothetical protein
MRFICPVVDERRAVQVVDVIEGEDFDLCWFGKRV